MSFISFDTSRRVSKSKLHAVDKNFETVPYFAAAKLRPFCACQDKNWNGPIFCSCQILDRFTKSKIKTHDRKNIETVPYFAAAKFETVSPCHVKNWNVPIFCSHKAMSGQKMKRSYILWLQILRPFPNVMTKIQMVPFFAATKFETTIIKSVT